MRIIRFHAAMPFWTFSGSGDLAQLSKLLDCWRIEVSAAAHGEVIDAQLTVKPAKDSAAEGNLYFNSCYSFCFCGLVVPQ